MVVKVTEYEYFAFHINLNNILPSACQRSVRFLMVLCPRKMSKAQPAESYMASSLSLYLKYVIHRWFCNMFQKWFSRFLAKDSKS